MQKSLLLGAGAAVTLYLLYQQGVSNTPGEGDPADTNGDGSATGGTDAGIVDEVIVLIGTPDYINAWADAITHHEGWGAGSRAYRNNNPGNLEVDGDLGRDAGGYGIFSTYAKGRNALVADLTGKVRKYKSWTLYQVMARYAPPKENNTQLYANVVAQALGVSTTTLVGSLANAWTSQGRQWTPSLFSSSDVSTPSPAPVQALDLSSLNPAPADFVPMDFATILGLNPVDVSLTDFLGNG